MPTAVIEPCLYLSQTLWRVRELSRCLGWQQQQLRRERVLGCPAQVKQLITEHASIEGKSKAPSAYMNKSVASTLPALLFPLCLAASDRLHRLRRLPCHPCYEVAQER